MHTASARLETVNGRRYLGQLCKHFGHKIPVDYSADAPDQGVCNFKFGRAVLASDEKGLSMRVEVENEADLPTAEDVVESHLARFAFREEIGKLAWN